MTREVQIYFFHLAVHRETDKEAWKWMSYTPARDFVTFHGVVPVHHRGAGVAVSDNAEDECLADTDCVAVIKTANDTTAVLLDIIHMESFRHSPNKSTMVKIRNVAWRGKIFGTNSWDRIDTCCPTHKQTDTEDIRKKVPDMIPRISCDIAPQLFRERFVKKSKPVILENCTKDWVAQNKWSFQNLLAEKDGKLRWRSKFESKLRRHKKFQNNEVLSGNLLKSIVKNNGTIRVFDKIGMSSILTHARPQLCIQSKILQDRFNINMIETGPSDHPFLKEVGNDRNSITQPEFMT